MDNNYAIPTSGDPDEDQRTLDRFVISDARIKSGNCPNGCGGMKLVDDYNAECLKCGFSYFSNARLDFNLGNKQ